ncbi:MAG: LON peptidase substrate-binding domain-containing protein, partial [Halioglobus sp.]|nr:LON peptidase substrate-binding domain-containing protein [Halioglobus sp.]
MSERDEAAVEVEAPESAAHTPAVADDVLPDTLYLMPIPHRPFFPGQVQPVGINPEQWGSTLEAVGKAGHGLIGLSYVSQDDPARIEPRQFPEIGCVVRLHRPPLAEQRGQFLAQGVKRFRIVRWLSD